MSRRGLPVCLAFVIAGTSCHGDMPGPLSAIPTVVAADVPGRYAQYRLNPAHAGLSPPGARVNLPLVLRWRSPQLGIGTYSASKSSPAVDGDMAYVGSDSGELFALGRTDGAIRWRFRTHRYAIEQEAETSLHLGIHGSPAIDEGSVYIGDYAGYLYAVDKRSGTLVWERLLGGSIGASPVLLGDFIFISVEFPEGDGRVFILRASTGEALWSSPGLGDFVHASVSLDVAARGLFVGANNGIFYAFDDGSSQPRWSVPTQGAIKSTAAVVDGRVFVTSWDGHLDAFDAASGRLLLQVTATAASMSSPAVLATTCYFGADDGIVYAVDGETGRRLWSFATGGPILSSPTLVADSNLVLVGSRDAHLYVLDAASGELRQAIPLDRDVTSVPVVVDDCLFVNDDGGTLYAFCGSGSG